jgi:hypothetical protein
MRSAVFLLLIMTVVLTTCPQGVSALAAFHPEASAEEKKPLTEKDIHSGSFLYLQQITSLDILGLRLLYATSGAREYDEFAQALLVAGQLQLNQQLVLRALNEKSLEEILQDFGFNENQAKEAIKVAKKHLETADKEWTKR